MRRLSYFVWLLVLVTFTLSPLTTSRKLNDKNLNEESSDDHSEAGLTEETAKADDEAKAGVFGFTFSPFTFLFGSDTDDEDKRGEKKGTDGASEENAEEETEKEALEEEKDNEAVERDKEVTDATEKESSVYSEDKKEIEDEDEQVLDTHADAQDESDIADNDKNEIQKSVNPAEAENGTTEMEENELGSDHNSEVRGRENVDKAIDAANTDVTDQRKSPSQENTDKYDLNTLHKTIEESTQGKASDVFIENEDDSFLETEPQSETVPADSGSQKQELFLKNVPSEATEKTTKYADTKEKKARKSNSDAGRNYTNLILVNSLKPMKPPSRRHHEKHHHRHLTNDVLPEVSGPASGREGHFKSEEAKVDNSSLMQADPRFCQPPMPTMDGLDRYMKTCENCLVQMDSYQCPMSDTALDLKKWMTELQELLSFGCQNGDTCERDSKCCHRKDPAMERAMNEMTELAKQVYTTFKDSCNNCPRNGGWSEWCEWSGCSVSCGDGTRSRYRMCINPSPKNGGRQCEGPVDDSLPCTGPSCCINGNWSPWSPWGGCGVTCGAGMQDRSRTCSNPPSNYCGLPCPGSSSDMRPCDSGVRCCIPQDGNWAPWSPWSDCSETCGPGMRDRSRTCSNPPSNECGRTCFGPQQDMERCDRGSCCVNGNWGPWQPWSQCSGSCGAGMRDRRRRCDNPPANSCGQRCPGRELEMDSCDTQIPCAPVCEDGNWGSWQPWSTCSATCGSGIQSRIRRCDSPSPNFCGRRCPGDGSDTQPCESGRDCCVDGNWGLWGPWNRCSVTCDVGSRDRRRRCDNPQPNYCGSRCPGSEVDRDTCTEAPCPIICVPRDGNWGSWSPWTPCSATCGPGTRERSHVCSNPPPNSCGTPCPGRARDAEDCMSGSCCVDGNWGAWEPWSRVSVTCGVGQRDRRRRCDSPQANYCGRPCPGLAAEREEQDTRVPCCVPQDGNWAPWSPWSACSASCGPGMRDRSRMCSNPPPNECGRNCPGPQQDTARCTEKDCCVDGNWGAWEPWSRVSVTCGVGQRDRSRRCDSPSANYCGRPCPGLAAEREEQDTRVPCCVPQDGNWAPWSTWSDCSASCGPGMRDRSRTCSNPAPNQCGRTCPGPQQDTARCTEKDCCVDGNWGAWGPWSRVSVTCGVGQRDRSRRCDSPPANYCGRPCPGLAAERDEEDTKVPCCVPQDGNWAPWSPWSACSATCGPGMRDRSRTCSNPAPNQCGRTCLGPQRDSERCTGGDCCVDGNWSQWGTWSACSETCGVGTQLRERTCSDPPANYCGKECMGPVRDTRRCNEGECCVDGNWGSWGSWDQCTKSCGLGTRNRRRRCDSPPANNCGNVCPGRDVDQGTCNEQPCPIICVPQDGNWAPWSQWTDCSATCGPGTRDRSRNCSNPAPNSCGRTCAGPARDMVKCDLGACCVDGNWGAWEPWSRVSATCGVGQRDRRRRCDSPQVNYCGRPCPGRDVETDSYDTRVPCQVCVHGNWGAWDPWSRVGVTCGVGQRDRRRRCDSPPANYCGRPCSGRDVEAESYDTRVPCESCVDGNWGPWGPWDSCSASCGFGQQLRNRRCDNPPPNICGQSCPGPNIDSRRCDQGPCCVDGNWGAWEPWSGVSVTCGVGQRDRRRRCDSPPANFCGRSCPGRDVETDSYDTRVPCQVCVDGNWGAWDPWSGVGVTCGVGQRDRRRRCDSPPANFCGRPCLAPYVEAESYDTRVPCQVCVDGNWGPWGPWDPCSVSCGFGQQLRNRRCDNPPPDTCGLTCFGPASDARACDQGLCCVDRQWSAWSRWSPCDVTCGRGSRSRDRTCQPVGFGPDCGNRCPGQATELEACPGLADCGPVCGPWSACSATCAGFGMRERRCTYQGAPGTIGASRVESERCQVFSPECPSSALWGEWESWCPCGCNNGRRSRRRSCVRKSRFGLDENVDLSLCGAGFAREEEYCDVRAACPLCLTDCAGRIDGDYPSCTSCNDYVTCNRSRVGLFSCATNGYVWDAFIRKCVAPPSPSCSLVKCVSSCMGLADGRYHSCFGCNLYVECRNGRDTEMTCKPGEEFNAHSGNCAEGLSPTCVRAIKREVDFLSGDAPADNYFLADDMNVEERRELYLELRKEAGVAAEFNREDEDVFGLKEDIKATKDDEVTKKKGDDKTTTTKEDKMTDNKGDDKAEITDDEMIDNEEDKTVTMKEDTMTKEKNGKKEGQSCRSDCSGVGPGMHQSCMGCRYYLICTKHGVARLVKCPRNKFWDDKRKKCKKHSRTCKGRTDVVAE